MCNSLLGPLIKKFKNQDMTVFPLIYENFKKLISLYASRLYYEDAVSELTLFLIELLFSIDLSRFENDSSFGIKKYIAVSIRNRYIALSIKNDKHENFSLELFENANPFFESFDEKILLSNAFMYLSDKQKRILIYKYIYGYSDCEISQSLGISRQAVNGIKNRALSSLREYFAG